MVTDVTGALHAKFGPASKSYFDAKRSVARERYVGDLNENKIFEYAQSHKFEEVTAGLSLLCSLPVDVVERALINKSKETLLILAKALGFSWETTMSLLFLGAPDHRIVSNDLNDMKREFSDLNIETSRSVLKTYQLRKLAAEWLISKNVVCRNYIVNEAALFLYFSQYLLLAVVAALRAISPLASQSHALVRDTNRSRALA